MSVNVPPSGEAAPPIYNGRYELRNQIARGGTAQVYLARDLLLDRPVALKVLFPELSSDSSFVERFRREAQAAANLSHPNIVPVFDWGESERTYFIVMEHIDGDTLSQVIRLHAPLPPLQAAAIAVDIAKALSYAHRHGVVHRDVKPGNVLITRDGQVKVADFGIARAVGADESVTQTGLVMGTATYFSPEQAQGLGVDGRSDVYSLGVVLYEMVTGRPPFMADTPVAIAYKHVSETPVPPRQIEPSVPPPLEAVIMHAMEKNPADRYATAEDLQADLQRFMQGSPVMAPMASVGLPTQAMPFGGVTARQGSVGTAATAVLGAAAAGGVAEAEAGAPTGQPAAGNGRGRGVPPGAPVMPKRRWIPWTVVGIVLIAALVPLVIYGAHQLGYLGGEGYFRVPSGLEGRQLATVKRVLERDGLVPDPMGEKSNAAKGIVLSTNPDKGAQVRKGDAVTVNYSLGPGSKIVPPLLGDSYSEAEVKLKSLGLGYVLKPTRRLQGQVLNDVWKTVPSANSAIAPNGTVTLYYYGGSELLQVPNVKNQPLATAQTTLTNEGFDLATPQQQLSSTVKKGDVISTSPPISSYQPLHSPITLIVSEGPGIAISSYLGKNYQQAENDLHNLGLVVTLLTAPSPPNETNLVIDQNPTGPTSVAPGSTVTLTYGLGHVVTVTSPGQQTSTVGTSVSLQIQATDSGGPNPTLAYTATNLPPGLTIDSSTGLISGKPTNPGTFVVTVTVTDRTGASGTQSFTWVVNP